jgi:hypothetical protein
MLTQFLSELNQHCKRANDSHRQGTTRIQPTNLIFPSKANITRAYMDINLWVSLSHDLISIIVKAVKFVEVEVLMNGWNSQYS